MRRRPTAKIRSSKTVLLVLVALQLVIGLQFQVAQAASVRMAMPQEAGAVSQPTGAVSEPADAGAQVDCPTHSTHHATDPVATKAPGTHAAGTHAAGADSADTHAAGTHAAGADSADTHAAGTHAAGAGPAHTHSMGIDKHAPMGTHDCCHASACQCHCVYTPAAIALPALANIVTSDSIPSPASAQFVAPRIHEFLRPPIT